MTNTKGSLEVFYSYPSDVDKSIELITDIGGVMQFNVGTTLARDISVRVMSTKEGYEPVFIQVQTYLGASVVDQSDFSLYTETEISFSVRIFLFDQFLSVSVNDKWIYSYAFASVEYPDVGISASLKLDGATTTITGLRRVELGDGREAVYVDYESNTENAIQSIIQQRPIQILPHVNRKQSFTYDQEKDTITAAFVQRYSERTTHPGQLSSDGLVYGTDVGVSIDLETARDVGFITKLYRLPELETGANAAAATIQKRARQQREMVTVVQRLDPRLEQTDVLHVDMVITSTERHIEREVIIEGISVGVSDGEYTMTITGRKKS